MDIAADLAMEAQLHAQTAGKSAVNGLKGFGGDFIHQLFGGGNNTPSNVSDDQLANMQSNDRVASDASYAQSRAAVMAIYEEYRMKRKREEEERREKEKQENQQQMAKLRGETRAATQARSQDIAIAMGKASAETGKSYGAE